LKPVCVHTCPTGLLPGTPKILANEVETGKENS
jgi:hypothetical protein